MLRTLALLALAGLAALLLGCGSSSESPKDAYIARLDAVCGRFRQRLEADAAALRRAEAAHGTARIAAALERRARDQALEYNALNDSPPPQEERLQAQRLLHAIEAQALIGDEYASALKTPGASDTSAFVEEIQLDVAEARKLARRYGFEVCGM